MFYPSGAESLGMGLLGGCSRGGMRRSCLQVQGWCEILVCTFFPAPFGIVGWEAENKALRKSCQDKKSWKSLRLPG